MKQLAKTIDLKFERTIVAPPDEVFDGWLNPEVPGNPWHEGEKSILDPKVDGLFFWLIRGTAHYGRFITLNRPSKIQHTWMSPNTLGEDTLVTLTFEKKGEQTLMTLLHTGIPDGEKAKRIRTDGTIFLDKLAERFEIA